MMTGVNQKCELNLTTTKQVSIVNCNSTYQSKKERSVLKLIELPMLLLLLLYYLRLPSTYEL